jgi:hypothetical protein
MYAYELAPGNVLPKSGTIASVRFRGGVIKVTLTNGESRFFYEDTIVYPTVETSE